MNANDMNSEPDFTLEAVELPRDDDDLRDDSSGWCSCRDA